MRNFMTLAILLIATGCSESRMDGSAMESHSDSSRDQQGPLDSLLTTVNSDAGESWLTLHPNGRIAVFGRHVDGFGDQRIYLTTWNGDAWSMPEIAPFAADLNERGPRFSAIGEKVYFASTRLTSEDDAENDWNIWYVGFKATETWGTPTPFSEINSPDDDFHPSASASGAIYFSSRRPESVGESDMFFAKKQSRGWTVEPVSLLNTQYSEPDPFISPDGSYLIFARTDGPGGFGGDDLYISYATDDGWTDPQNLGSEVNTEEYEYGASVTSNGKALIYTTWASGDAQIAAIDLNALDLDFVLMDDR